MNKELKKITKLNKKEKLVILFYIILIIFYIAVAFLSKNVAWLVCGLLWDLIALKEVLSNKIIKLKDSLIEDLKNEILILNFRLLSRNIKLYNQNKAMDLMAKELTNLFDEDPSRIKEIFFKKAKGEK